MPKKKRPNNPNIVLDSGLVGTWYACSKGHRTTDPIFLSTESFCPNLDCDLPTILIHRVRDDRNIKWRDFQFSDNAVKI